MSSGTRRGRDPASHAPGAGRPDPAAGGGRDPVRPGAGARRDGHGQDRDPAGGSRASHHRNVAITRGMRRVTISHCAFRRGYTDPVLLHRDMPHGQRVQGRLRAVRQAAVADPARGRRRRRACCAGSDGGLGERWQVRRARVPLRRGFVALAPAERRRPCLRGVRARAGMAMSGSRRRTGSWT